MKASNKKRLEELEKGLKQTSTSPSVIIFDPALPSAPNSYHSPTGVCIFIPDNRRMPR